MMEKRVGGKRYNFIIELEMYGRTNSFQILSLFKEKGEKSTITNINYIISELIFPVLKSRDIDSIVFLNKKQGEKLFKGTVSAFNDKLWIKELENHLDEDRSVGGWNSNFKF